MIWADIVEICKGKQIIIYGLGAGAKQFFEGYGNDILLSAIIDNDVKKQGNAIGDLLLEAFQTANGNIIVKSAVDVLNAYAGKDIVILIASKNGYREIEEELRNKGFFESYRLFELADLNAPMKNKCDLATMKQEYLLKCLSMPIQKKKIVFSAFADYADHEKYISEAIARLNKEFDIVWIVNDINVQLPETVRKVCKTNWKKLQYEVETAGFWITDLAVPANWIKRKEQIYIQTKHWASVTLKKFYLDAASSFKNEVEKLNTWKRESEIIDYIVVGSEFDKESCKRGFQFDKEFIMAGSPRSDAMFSEKDNKEKVHRYFDIKNEKHILLYAPTYRFNKQEGNSVHESREIGFDYEQVKDALENKFGGEWIIALRLHPSVASYAKDMQLPDYVINVSDYRDSQELVSAADITISDYSSIMFEPAFVKKPVFLYATDLTEYLKREYELLIEYKELPFPIAETEEQLCDNIISFDKVEYENKVTEFLNKYGVNEDGHASDRVASFVLSKV